MVRVYKKKSNRLSWNEGQMELAVQKVLEGRSCKSVASDFGVPRTTLLKKCKLRNHDHPIKVVGFKRVFDDEQEIALKNEIENMEKCMMGLTSYDVRKLAFDFAEKLRIPHNFNRTEGLAGKDWVHNFLKRHDLSFRKSEHTSAARAHGFNQEAVKEFYTLLKKLLDEHNFAPEKIFNVDETSVSVVPKSSPKVIARRGRGQVGGLTAAERGETVTAEVCMSAAGMFMPLLLIFPRVKVNQEFLNDAPPGAWAEFHKTGYMQTEIFARWFKKFIEFSHAKPEDPVLLLLDGHASHVKNLEVIEMAKEHGVKILCFPPHCTHKMQPLDVGFMGPLSITFGKKVSALQRQGMQMTMRNIFSVFGKAFLEAAKMDTAVNSFKRCGIVPFNPNIFKESDFVTAKKNIHLTPEDNPSVSSTPRSAESIATIASYSSTIQDLIMQASPKVSQPSQKVSQPSQLNSKESSTFNKHDEQEKAEEEVRIPLSYILQARPLFDFLSPIFQANSTDVPQKHSDASINNEIPHQTRVDNQPGNSFNDTALNAPDLLSSIEDGGTSIELRVTSTPTSSSTPTETASVQKKKGRVRGKAAIITEDS
ncbi:uncharacterized protein LOC107982227 [Nasonia vitripennis]|uniref:HTH CENPB-type domain-containing protein n=1 Tax=Nasonia vitripennis TaxID=7425 RepID=A0A7M7IYC0_NASVI|nr:uncharacterized protein LOC107982227 [Nasonia vitripennis]